MRKNRHWLLTMAMLLSSITLSAYDFEVNGLGYSILSPTELTVSVAKGSVEPVSNLVIPSAVSYENNTYQVVGIGNSAFSGCTSIKTIELPESVEFVGYNAFYNTAWWNNQNDGVVYLSNWLLGYKGTMPVSTTIDIVDGTIGVAVSAFLYKTELVGVSIPNTLKYLSQSAFNGCTRLTSIEFPSSIISIGASAFYQCSGLTAINIPASVTSIGANAFYKCTNLETMTIADNAIVSIGNSAFESCTKLVSVNFGNSELTIGEKSFYGCSNLTELTLSNVKSLGNQAFSYTGLTVVNLEYIEDVGISAFAGCSQLVTVKMGRGIKSIGTMAFSSCRSLINFHINDLASWCSAELADATSHPLVNQGGYIYIDGVKISSLEIPSEVTTISANTFMRTINITSVTIPNTVKSIGTGAFSNCSGLVEVTSKALTPPTMLSDGFYNVANKATLYVPEKSIDSYRNAEYWNDFSNIQPIVSYIASGTCGDNLTWKLTEEGKMIIEDEGPMVDFTSSNAPWNSYKSSIKEIVIGDGVTRIGNSAFSGCQNLTSVTLPSTVKELGEYAFNYCTSLKSVNLPEELTTIGPRAFRICHSLTSMEIPATVTTIGESAFYECKALQSVAFKGSVESIGSGAFNLCSALAKVSVDDIADWCQMGFTDYSANPLYYASNLYVGDALLTELTVPSGVTAISNYAFDGYEKLTSVDFGEGVETIGSYAFRSCSGLTTLTIPGNVTSIENNAFYGCTNVGEIIIEDSEETLAFGYNNDGSTTSGMFSTCYLQKPVYVGRNLSYDTSREGACSPFNLAGWYNTVESVTFGELVTEIPAYLLYNTGIYISDVYFQFRSNPTIGTNAFAPNQEIHLALDDAESTDFNAANENTFASAEYNRSLEKGKFGTIMLPFAPKNDKYVFFKLTKVEGNVLTFDEESEPKANTPYLYRLRDDAENGAITAEGSVTIVADIANPDVVSNWQMVGSFINQIIETENLDTYYYGYAASDNKLHRVTKKMTVKPYRAYFTTNGNQPAQLAVRTRDGETTLVDAAEVEDLTPETYYDLSGRRVENPIKGVYIVNGKKVIR